MLVLNQPKLNFVVIGNPENRRVTMFQGALANLGQPLAKVVSYLDLISKKVNLIDVVTPNSIVRIDSTGENFEVEKALLTLGAEAKEPLNKTNFSRISIKQTQQLTFNKGLILYPYQWYLGYLELLKIIKEQLNNCPKHWLMNHPDDILLMFDKSLCHNYLLTNNIAVAPSLGQVSCFDELQEKMQKKRWHRVFIKLANGSSASGVVAYQTNGKEHIATTSTKVIKKDSILYLYNSLKLSVYRNLEEIRELIDALCKHYVHVERWMPKASFQNSVFDLRVLVVGKKASHVVVRTSKTPITNLHLLNKRGNLAELQVKIGNSLWKQAMEICESTMELFPKSLYAGIDLMFLSGFNKQLVLEVNAFGDLLPNILYNQLDSYEAQILEILENYD